MPNTTEFINNVQREIDQLQDKIGTLQEKKSELDRQMTEVRAEIKRRADLLLVWEGKADVRPMVERKARERSRRGFTMNAVIVEILEQSDRHMSAHEILDELKKRNAEGTSKSPISSVRNALQILKKRGQVVSPAYGLVCLPGRENLIAGSGQAVKTIRRPGNAANPSA
ncbi:MAG: hypothetical protein M5R36_18545 [Deltaproteobacteria bacterium]|nr:hypothetical protein [Deltaproteobacteria bacterium]